MTIDIGPNDVLGCFKQGVFDPICVKDGLKAVLNAIETDNYQQFGFALAPVADVFRTNNPETSPFTQRPVNVTHVCVLTLMCTATADIHPNQLGYWVIATTFARTFHSG